MSIVILNWNAQKETLHESPYFLSKETERLKLSV